MGAYITNILNPFLLKWVILILLNLSTAFVPVPSVLQEFKGPEKVRVNRQAGYVYNKPSISFNLPSRPTTVSTQASTVDRTQEQQMYYAYPAPAGGNTVNIGYSTTGPTATSTAATPATGGYNYGAQNTASVGVQTITGSGSPGYGSQAQIGSTANSGSQVYTGNVQTGSAVEITGSTGYTYNLPTQTVSTAGTVSTNAPLYLPPTGSGGSGGIISVGGSVGGGGGGSGVSSRAVVSGGGTTSSGGSISSGVSGGGGGGGGGNVVSVVSSPLDSYLPPSISGPSTSVATGSTVTQTGTNVAISSPTSGYLAPKPSLPVIISTGISSSPAPVPTVNTRYLPPVVSLPNPPTQVTVSTPAATYLPPVF